MFTDVESSPVYTLIRDIEAQSKAERCNVNGTIAKKKTSPVCNGSGSGSKSGTSDER